MTVERRGIDEDFAVTAVLASIADVVVADVCLVGLRPFRRGDVGIAALTGAMTAVLVERVTVVFDETVVRI
jgi:hypothetical protein